MIGNLQQHIIYIRFTCNFLVSSELLKDVEDYQSGTALASQIQIQGFNPGCHNQMERLCIHILASKSKTLEVGQFSKHYDEFAFHYAHLMSYLLC